MDRAEMRGAGQPIWPVRIKRPSDRRSLSRSATRALDVLELFGRMRRPLRAIEIVHALDLHPSTANQLLKTMVESAHLTFEASSKAYLPSSRLAHFGDWMVENFGVDEWLRRLVWHVQSVSGETVTLMTPNDLFMQIVDLVDSGNIGKGAERGLRVSIFGSTAGDAYLSTLPDADIVRLATRARIPPAEYNGLLARMARVRDEGVAEGPSLDSTVWSVAAPFPRAASPAPLVLGLAGPNERVRPNITALKDLLRTAIARAEPYESVAPVST